MSEPSSQEKQHVMLSFFAEFVEQLERNFSQLFSYSTLAQRKSIPVDCTWLSKSIFLTQNSYFSVILVILGKHAAYNIQYVDLANGQT